MINIGFVTGARSEYGVMKRVISEFVSDKDFNVSIIATGMHYQHKYGDTIGEIRKDALAPIFDAPCYTECEQEKVLDFTSLVHKLNDVLREKQFDIIYIVGDRLEAYSAALAAHFLRIPVAHFAGGQITEGAVDNIYRYNISNLALFHFVTNKYAKERLSQIPIISNENIFLVGSSAVDSISAYLNTPQEASIIDARLRRGNFVLMTYHSETKNNSINTIPAVMDVSIQSILEKGLNILVTYPNNDDGNSAIIDVINKWKDNPNIIVRKNLGVQLYYVAVDNSLFVVGNSSSGIIEVPYFQKYTINVGERQLGRNVPKSVISVGSDCVLVRNILEKIILNPICSLEQEYIYGNGNSAGRIHKILRDKLM